MSTFLHICHRTPLKHQGISSKPLTALIPTIPVTMLIEPIENHFGAGMLLAGDGGVSTVPTRHDYCAPAH